MLYIVTYATHAQDYYELLIKTCPNIIVLGFGEEWKGFGQKCKTVVEFCKTKNPEDIICVIDGFDSVCLCNSEDEIVEKFKSFNSPIVFSKDVSINNSIKKYLLEKTFGKCRGNSLNAGLYIGYSESIIELWKHIESGEDDQKYATKKCKSDKEKKIKIDVENKLFYNYSINDKTGTIEGVGGHKRLIIGENSNNPCFISGPGDANMNNILTALGFDTNDLPKKKFQYVVRIKRYFNEIIPEISWIFISAILYFLLSNKLLAIIISFVLFLELIHYELYVKHIDTSVINKFIYILIDIFHISITIFVFYLLLNWECDMFKLILLDSLYLIIIFLFFIFKKCFLTTFENRVLNVDENCNSVSRETRLNYFFDINANYYPKIGNNTMNWMNGNILIVFLIALLNVFCLWKIYNKKCTTACKSRKSKK
jgi:hypothetical protein